MNKKLFSLFLSIIGLTAVSQVTIKAPAPNSSSQLRAPNGFKETKYMKACYLIKPSELVNMPVSNVSQIGFSYVDGDTLVAAPGTMTVYLENTSDATFNKSLDFGTATSSMGQFYNGTFTVLPTNGSFSLMLTLSSAFSYTGGGIYVAFEWVGSGPFATLVPATYEANNAGTGNNLGATLFDSIPLPTPPIMSSSDFRPSFLLKYTNTSTNDLAVLDLQASGKVSKFMNSPEVVTATIKNLSSVAKSNVSVSLTVSGANSFSDVQTITNIAPGATTAVSFNGYVPTSNGINTVAVTLAADQKLTNNLQPWTQSVTCNEIALSPPGPVVSSAFGFGGSTGSGIFCVKQNIPANCSLAALRFAVGTSNTVVGKKLYGVLMDAAGDTIGNSTNSITVNNSQLGTFITFSFGQLPLSGGTDCFFGVAQTTSGYYPLGVIAYTNFPAPFNYFVTSLAGGAMTPITNYDGYFGLEPVLSFTNSQMSVVASQTRICIGELVSLEATGTPTAYIWSANVGGQTTASVVVSPTVSSPTGTGNVNYQVTGIDPSTGCKTSSASVLVNIAACTGMNKMDGGHVSMFPNPSVNGISKVSGLNGENAVTVIDITGKTVSTGKSERGEYVIDLSSQPAGVYLVRIVNANNEVWLEKLAR